MKIRCASAFRYGMLLMALIGMMACGGGGGGGGGGGDTTAPQVGSVVPADLSTGVAMDTEISVTFNESMAAATISVSSITISPAVSGSVSYDTAAMRATFTPSTDLDASTTYTVTISTACTDAAGNALAAAYNWSFTTGSTTASGWVQVGSQISPASAESEDPTMLIVDNTPVVGYRHGSFEINLNVWDGTSWGTSEVDPSGGDCSTSNSQSPSMCSNGSTLYMAYAHLGDSSASDGTFYDRIFVYQWTSVGGWAVLNGGAEVSVPWNSVVGGTDAYEPAIGCIPGDLPWVAWSEGDAASATDADTDHTWVAEMTTTSSSTRSDFLSRNDGSGGYQTDVRTVGIVVDDAGCSYAAQWESDDDDQDRTDLYVTRYCPSGGGFTNYGSAVTDDYDYNNLSKPSMVLMGGTLYIAYTQANSTDYTQHVYVKKYDAGNWVAVGSGPVSAFSASDHYDSGHPQLAVVDGDLFVAWDESNQDSGPFIYVANFDTSASEWVLCGEQLNVDTSKYAHDPSLAYDATTGYLYVAFEEETDGWPQIFVKRRQLNP